MDFWESDDYREAIKIRVEERKSYAGVTYQALATSCKIDKAYLSRVLGRKADLSQDQVYLAAKYLGIDGLDRDFLFTLHAYSRSSLKDRRADLLQSLAAIRKQAQTTQEHIMTGAVEGADQIDLGPYFLDPDAQLVHVFLTIERYRRDPSAIGKALGLGEERFSRILILLGRLGLIETGKSGIRVTREALHLPASAASYPAYRLLLRQRGLGRMQALDADDGYFFSVLFSGGKAEAQTIQQRFLELLSASEVDVRNAPAANVYQMTFDLFPWSEETGKLVSRPT